MRIIMCDDQSHIQQPIAQNILTRITSSTHNHYRTATSGSCCAIQHYKQSQTQDLAPVHSMVCEGRELDNRSTINCFHVHGNICHSILTLCICEIILSILYVWHL